LGVPPGLESVPFAPFSKNDQLGKASDWTNSNFPRVQAGACAFFPACTGAFVSSAVFVFWVAETVLKARSPAGRHNVSNVFNFSMDNEVRVVS
jgi:hypothetical protein